MTGGTERNGAYSEQDSVQPGGLQDPIQDTGDVAEERLLTGWKDTLLNLELEGKIGRAHV